ncbi:MAG TPA: DUF998 domain-containing protein [Bryobacteraceae bacterium]|jgi:hypothetical protein|nr:DUF998 domain-containing protein [Bryobacteraceae bacterium]
MTSTTFEDRPAAISVRAARLAMGAIVLYQALLILLIFLRPDLDPSWHTISEWAIGPYGSIMSAAFLISALSYAALLLMLRSQLHGVSGRIGCLLLSICVIGATGVGLFKTDPMPIHPPLSIRGTLHVVFGTSQLVLLPFAAFFINLSLVRYNEAWRRARRLLLWTGGLPLFGLLSFVIHSAIFVFPLGPGAYGPGVNIGWPPRFAFFTYMLWVVTLSWQAIQCSRHTTRARQERDDHYGRYQFQNG